ncbi:MAG: hypothetical protein ACREP9_06195 [Candidatus Dormibacteraceae bacterium]
MEFEVAFTQHLAGSKAVGSGRFAAEPLVQQVLDFGRPSRGVVAPRGRRSPGVLLMVGAGFEVVAVEFVKAATGQAKLFGDSFGFELASTKASQ